MKVAWENLGFGMEDVEPSTMTLLLGVVCSQLLSLEKVTWLWIPSPWAFPNGPTPHPIHSPPLWGHFFHDSLSSVPIRLAQQGVINSLRSANLHTFPARDANTSPAPQSGIPTSTSNTDSQAYKVLHTSSTPHSLGFSEVREQEWHTWQSYNKVAMYYFRCCHWGMWHIY